ncbi:MAG: indolepyruvate oxidoreductase subunit beta [Clostridiales bacterium]|uniref:indolepyruvate oxidoreductase subunit beta n=1 Tax=Oscillospiraceae TaxID=216572 RepID=UPI0009A6FB5E|nr:MULTISPECIES: indolepyruvate oxidoreductase subunit beta [Oscillospiraceae]PWM38579.1 MAG: indolepyruvate oxidoreductase subunit beta [Clostridiales bacterium]RGB67317.1 indolepyruvate oxidoreductase subunit beta [Harryflintia acetispora]
MNTTNIMIVGVGGQGTLLASRILGSVTLQSGLDVKVSEVHGMSQRGGSVVTYVKYGEKVLSPVIDKGEADYIVSFELLEAARWVPYLKMGGKLITNTQQIDPMPVITGAAEYPKDLVEKIKAKGVDILAFDALSPALQAGNAKAVNVVLMGVLSTMLGFDKSLWTDAVKALVPEKLRQLNLEAFELGVKAAG